MKKRAIGLLGLAATPLVGALMVPFPENSKIDYRADVAPILKAHCASCHSGSSASAGLNVLSTASLLRVVKVGSPSASVLVRRIKGLDSLPRMPMGFAPLSGEDVKKIESWITQGASITGANVSHWAYSVPKRPDVPSLNSPWVKNPIDSFIFQRLNRERLKPSHEADRETLLRRVTLDLTGLPPTLAEIDAFLADRRPDAYEKVVDRLLASPRFGERQARFWLDLARYADTDGYEKDLSRNAWPYRDWVINAFNQNMPYDQFTVQQLAGDLLPKPTRDQLVATGFHRNTMFNREGGVDQREAHFAVILDRVDTTATVWLGSTLGCARCHDHKYDPFTQKDYYKMAAFFSNTVVQPRGPKEVGEEKWFEPVIPYPSNAQEKAEIALNERVTELTKAVSAPVENYRERLDAWKAGFNRTTDWRPLNPEKSNAENSVLNVLSDRSVLAIGQIPDQDQYRMSFRAPSEGVTGVRLTALTDPSLGSQGPGRNGNGNFVMTGFKVSRENQPVPIIDALSDFLQSDYSLANLVTEDRSSGWAISPKMGIPHDIQVAFAAPIPAGAVFEVELDFHSPWKKHELGRFRIDSTSSINPLGERLGKTLKASDLERYFVEHLPEHAKANRELAQAKAELKRLQDSIPTAPILQEKPTVEPPFTYVHRRGEFLSRTQLVQAAPPSFLSPFKTTRPDRLALAKWIVSPDNPLTARVEVNRIWEQYFGRGLVETSEDFGTRGAKASHPELLDWLATEFMRRHWDIKAIHRLIVTSATYRQASESTRQGQDRDSSNILLSRGPRFRLDAEAIRDTALYASGLMGNEIGGPSVYPYQPAGIWDSPYSGELWMTSAGRNLYRRSLYTFWKRTATYPFFTSFDATTRESCTVRRIRTNTPLQALALLNDQEMLEAAKALARRMQSKKVPDRDAITLGFRACTGRRPTLGEIKRLLELKNKVADRYRQNPEQIKSLNIDAEAAAWTMVGNVLLNLDETVTKS